MIYYNYSPYYYPNARYRPPSKPYSKQIVSKPEKEIRKEPEQKRTPNKSNNEPLFEIFGIQLYFDDILLICLIFFLYNEGVKDEFLFISLILLLLS